MAHNLATINGRVAMAYQGETPWHKLGTRMDAGVVDIGRAMEAASLNFDVELQAMYLKDSTIVPNKFAVTRDGNVVLGTVSGWYKPIQYRDAFGVFQPAVEEFGLTVEAAGALGHGEKAWMLFRLPTTIAPVAGDDINGYGVAVTGHDGKTVYQFRPTPVRVVCQNTLDAALGVTGLNSNGSEKGRVFSIQHIGNVDQAVDGARTLVRNVIAAMQETGETFTAMAHKELTGDQVKAFIETVFPTPADGKLTDQLARRRSQVAELVWNGVGAELAMSETNGRPNPWSVYNAVTEWADHVIPAQAKSEAGARKANTSALFGSYADLKLLALRQAQRLVAA